MLRLLDIPAAKLTGRFNYLLGPLFESLATLSVRVSSENGAEFQELLK